MGLSTVRRTYFSELRLTLRRNITFQLSSVRWLLHVKGSFIWTSSNKFVSPPPSARQPLPSPPPLVGVAFHTHSQLNQCSGRPCLRKAAHSFNNLRLHPGFGAEERRAPGRAPRANELEGCFLPFACFQVEQILTLQSANWRGMGRELGISEEKEVA